MSLSTTRPIDRAMVEAIFNLPDDIYRNHWITFAYHRISKRLQPHIGDNASWCTFARWSSYTVGESLDIDAPNRRLDDLLKSRLLRPFRAPLQDLNRDLRKLSDSSMPRLLGVGNRYVFRDIGCATIDFIEWYESALVELRDATDDVWDAAWRAHRKDIHAFDGQEMFQAADVDLLRDGLGYYFAAMRCTGSDEQSLTEQTRHMLHGSLTLAVYEQWRLDPILKLALDPSANHLVEFRSQDPTDPVPEYRPNPVLLSSGTPWAFRQRTGVRKWLADQYAQSITRYWLTYDAPLDTPKVGQPDDITPIVVGKGVPAPSEESETREQRKWQRRLVDETKRSKLVSIYDRNGEQGSEGARNWTRFSDRMQFIVELFRGEQGNARLYADSHLETEILLLDISKSNLNELRTIGDDAMDIFVAEHIASTPPEEDARQLVMKLVHKGLRPDLGSPLPPELDGTLPGWVDNDSVEAGQRFLSEHALQIASALFNASLPKSYTSEHGTRVLTATAELASGNINRRIAETGQLLLDLMKIEPGPALGPGSVASDAARGVRLFHAAVRHMLLNDKWDSLRRGAPINQEDLIGTLVAFTVVALDALEDMGVKVSPDDKANYVHLWQVVGYLLGIEYERIHREEDPPRGEHGMATPPGLAELRVLGHAIYRRNSGATPDGQALTASLMRMTEESLPKFMRSVPATTTRWLLGDEAADALEVPPSEATTRLALILTRPITRLVSSRKLGRGFTYMMEKTSHDLYDRWINTYRDQRPEWRIDPEMRKRWGITFVKPVDRRSRSDV